MMCRILLIPDGATVVVDDTTDVVAEGDDPPPQAAKARPMTKRESHDHDARRRRLRIWRSSQSAPTLA
jgi:hypothetical protein